MQKLQGKESKKKKKKKQQDDDRMMMCTGLRGVWCVREWWEERLHCCGHIYNILKKKL